jgi:lipid II:glycine glycyltransferase (peptidoglycan interpeptide bridge formation enzyme)
MYSWGAFDKYTLEIDEEINKLKKELNQSKITNNTHIEPKKSENNLNNINQQLKDLGNKID